MEDSYSISAEIGRYIEILLRQWRIILSTMILCAAIAVVNAFTETEKYQARALVATVKTATDVSFGSGIETLSEEQLATSSRFIDPKARLQSYVKIVDSPDLAESVLENLGDRLPRRLRTAQALLRITKGEIAERSDLIAVVVIDTDPVIATEIANVWAKAYIAKVNRIYSASGKQESLLAIQEQTENAQQMYNDAQAELVTFLGENRVSEYTRQISDTLKIIEDVSMARSIATGEVISGTVQSQLSVFNEQNFNLRERLAGAYEERRKTNRLLNDTRDMLAQVEEGGEGAVISNALSLILLKSQALTTNEELPNLQIQITPADITQEEMLADLDAMINVLEARSVIFDQEIQSLSNQLLDVGDKDPGSFEDTNSGEANTRSVLLALSDLKGLGDLAEYREGESVIDGEIQKLEEELKYTNAQLEIEQARENELRRARDLAWSTYEILSKKEAELVVASQAGDIEVALAAPAMLPTNNTISMSRTLLIGVVVGALIGIGIALSIEFWWSYKGLAPYAITLHSVFKREK
jgi:uncharacterized protein involved in exopolysaccharide biosynthesis